MWPSANTVHRKTRLKIRAVALSISLLIFVGVFPSKFWLSAQELDFTKKYERLQKLEFPDLKRGDTKADEREERAIRDYFVQSGDAGARFLIGKLRRMNDDERKFLGGSDQLDIRVTQYMQSRIEQGQSNKLKYAIGFILADAFPHTDADTQTAILKELVNSYTPSTYGKEDRQFLDFALDRIGRAGVPYLIQVAGHNFPTVRCGAMSSLTGLADDAKKARLPDAPRLNCDAAPKVREAELNEWKAWWEKYGDKFPFPELPSFFDLNVEGVGIGELH
jgi:hypothetical protein